MTELKNHVPDSKSSQFKELVNKLGRDRKILGIVAVGLVLLVIFYLLNLQNNEIC
jgi:tetrahydromethanopterin S-methyltransferase subunit G